MRAIKIDAVNRTVEEIEIAPTLKNINEQVGSRYFTTVHYEENDVIYCDDEGLLTNPQNFFTVGTYPQPIAGNGLLLGTDLEGNTVACEASLESVKNDVIFVDLQNVLKKYV